MSGYKEVILDFNKKGIRYCVLRNYTYLSDPSVDVPDDLDVTIHRKDINKAHAILKRHGFLKSRPGYSKHHIGYMKLLIPSFTKITFDIQIGGVYWNDIPYIKDEELIGERKTQDYFYVPSDRHTAIMLICHSILGKRYFKPEYEKVIKESLAREPKKVREGLQEVFGQRLTSRIMGCIKKDRFRDLEKRYTILAYFIARNPDCIMDFGKVLLKWLSMPKYNILLRPFSGMPMITLMGPDGSGKSTNAEMLKEVLEKNKRRTEIVYTGRGKSNLLPISKVGRAYKRVEKKKLKGRKCFKRILYTLVAPIYTLDFLLRYIVFIYPKRRNRIVITDRYASDMLLMKNVPLGFRRVLLIMFPCPDITFYLYNTPEKLYARKPEHPPKELKRQMKLYKVLQRRFDARPIVTDNLEEDFKKIAKRTMQELHKLGY